MLDLLGALLHDKEEDLTREELGATEWGHAQAEFARVLAKIDADHRWFLGERIALLRRRDDRPTTSTWAMCWASRPRCQTSSTASWRTVWTTPWTSPCSGRRLTNTISSRRRSAFFSCPTTRCGPRTLTVHLTAEACVLLISQLFKNVVLMSMLREKRLDSLDDVTNTLFAALAAVGRAQAEWGAGRVAHVGHRELPRAPSVGPGNHGVLCGGRHRSGDRKERGGLLDGSLLEHFAEPDDKLRKRRLGKRLRQQAPLHTSHGHVHRHLHRLHDRSDLLPARHRCQRLAPCRSGLGGQKHQEPELRLGSLTQEGPQFVQAVHEVSERVFLSTDLVQMSG